MENNDKRTYSPPIIEKVILDNEISLVLQSASPPSGPNETTFNAAPEYFNNDPFKTNIG